MTSIPLVTGLSSLVKAKVKADPFVLPGFTRVAILLGQKLRPTLMLRVALWLKSKPLASSIGVLRVGLRPGEQLGTVWFGIYVLLVVNMLFTLVNILLGPLLVTIVFADESVLGWLSITM